jgi:hypothetical protein
MTGPGLRALLKVLDMPGHPHLTVMIDAVRKRGITAPDDDIIEEYRLLIKRKLHRD